MSILPVLPLVCVASAAMYLRLKPGIHRAATSGRHLRSIGSEVESRYDVLVAQLHGGFQTIGVALIGYRIFLWRDSNNQDSNHFGAETSALVTAVVMVAAVFATILVLNRVMRSMAAKERMMVFRWAYMANEVCFRAIRVADVINAPDRDFFVRNLADVLSSRYAGATTWSSFAGGLFVGIMQPSKALIWSRVCFLLTVVMMPLLPPTVGFVYTGYTSWLTEVLRLVTWPYMLGYLMESTQRMLINQLLAETVRNEQAIALPPSGCPVHATSGNALFSSHLSLDDFEPVGILGFGGSSQVRLVRQKGNGAAGTDLTGDSELRALKSVFKVRRGVALNESGIGRVREECRILNVAHNHPFIVQIFDAFEDVNCFHFVLEYAPNGPLSLWLTESLQEPVAQLVGAEVLSAIGHLHSLGVVYRDLKPENILVRKDGHVILADFGISKRLRDTLTATTTTPAAGNESFVGTPGWMAPEVVRRMTNASVRPSSEYKFEPDYWAFGVLINVMLTLDDPMQIETISRLLKQAPRLAADTVQEDHVGPEELLSSSARSLVVRLLELEPQKRLGSVGGIREIMAQPFFDGIDWQGLVQLKLPPPFPSLGSSQRGESADDPVATNGRKQHDE